MEALLILLLTVSFSSAQDVKATLKSATPSPTVQSFLFKDISSCQAQEDAAHRFPIKDGDFAKIRTFNFPLVRLKGESAYFPVVQARYESAIRNTPSESRHIKSEPYDWQDVADTICQRCGWGQNNFGTVGLARWKVAEKLVLMSPSGVVDIVDQKSPRYNIQKNGMIRVLDCYDAGEHRAKYFELIDDPRRGPTWVPKR